MISYAVYKVIHLIGMMMVFLALGGAAASTALQDAKSHPWRKRIAITHGIGLFLSLLGGFGLLARLEIVHGGLPGWALAKIGIWLIFGAALAVLLRKPQWAKVVWPAIILLGGIAAYIAGSKPF